VARQHREPDARARSPLICLFIFRTRARRAASEVIRQAGIPQQ
jgi:hypothetical protein